MLKTAILATLLAAAIPAFATGPEKVTTVIFVNAAEEEATPSAGLSTEGQDQARMFTEALRHIDVAAIYTIYQNKAVQTVGPLSELRQLHPVYYWVTRDSETRECVLDCIVKKNKGKTIVICGNPENIPAMARSLGVRAKAVKTLYDKGSGQFLIVQVLGNNTAVAQKLNMNIQKKV
ncbi:hypothetical protein [Chitinophaga qingshengii]|uniref:Uncharacterized protein n=1 Tax=Chitinophaga qingshengii TaxID=1569794 RepID=A0ABR7TH15_9BACT|nr:hypothetical protein [Chitinophaga qingshengii]MBC9928813.1 hypothetical protein [Chitinophaga qingshengii]